MTTLLKTNGAQWVLTAIFGPVNIAADAMVNTSAVLTNFKATTGTVYDVLDIPVNGVLVGGDLVVNTVSNDTGTSTASIGDPSSATRYLGATNLKAAARTALVPTGRVSSGEKLRVTVANQNGDATAGQFTVSAQFVIQGRVNENLKTS